MRITFHGAARQVTGSAHLLEINGRKILLDCGLFDSDRIDPLSLNRQWPYDPRDIDAVIVSHAHNDHIGRLPCLVRAGYRGPIYVTRPTADITNVMLRDSARIQRDDQRNGHGPGRTASSRGSAPTSDADKARDASPTAALATPPLEPLFELPDVEWVVEQFVRLDLEEPAEVVPGVTLTYHDSGHILGSAIIQLDFEEDGKRRRFVFTGDLGRRGMGLLPDPVAVRDIDILVSESTYGARELEPKEKLIKQLHAIIARAHRLQSRVVIPAFSLGRTQMMVYCLQELFAVHKLRPIPVYVDSPLALRLTDIHREYPESYTAEAQALMNPDPKYFGSKYVEFCESWDDSRRLNYQTGPMVIIASSGMCEAGRIRHHLRHTVSDPDNAIVIVSYQAEKTLGRKIAEGIERLQIMDQWHELNAAVYVLDGFSGHADRNDLAAWYESTGGGIEKAFLVHGDPDALDALAPVLQPHVTSPVEIPERGVTYEV